jgi:hypothetical protein
LQIPSSVLYRVVPGNTPPLFCAEDTVYVHIWVYWSVSLSWLSCRYSEALIKTGQEIPQDQVSFRDITGPAKTQL